MPVAMRRALSAGTLLVFGGGLALYQMTSLVLGPASSRQLHISLILPAIEREALPEPVASSVELVLGSLAVPAAALAPAPVMPTPRRTWAMPAAPPVGAPAPSASVPATPVKVSPVSSATPRPTDHPRPPIIPWPQPPSFGQSI